jgi:superfamily II DNA or RNA helicase
MAKELRQYQKEMIAATLDWWDNVDPNALISAWVGSGKTFTFVKLVRQIYYDQVIKTKAKRRVRVLVLAHRKELIDQPYKAFLEEFTYEVISRELKVGRVGGTGKHQHRDYNADIICCSIPSLIQNRVASKHLEAILAYGDIDVVIYDEVHHSVAEVNMLLIQILRERNPNLKLLGVTATPQRSDGVSLGNIFKAVLDRDEWTYYYGYKQALRDKVSVPIVGKKLVTNIDVGTLHVGRKGEISEKNWNALWEAGNWGALMWEALKEHGVADGAKCFHFAPSTDIAGSFTKFLGEQYGIESGFASANGFWRWSNHRQEMVKIDREELWKLYERDDGIHLLNNYNIYTEGVDSPRTKLELIGRATQSPGTFYQMTGRVTRPFPGPLANGEIATVLTVDYDGHPFLDTDDLTGEMLDEEAKAVQKALDEITIKSGNGKRITCPDCGEPLEAAGENKLRCPNCNLTMQAPDENGFLNIVDESKPSGKGVHYIPIKLMTQSDVSWAQEDGIFSVYLGTAGYKDRVPLPFQGLHLNDDQYNFLEGKAERVLIIAAPGRAPAISSEQFALIGVKRPVKSSEWRKNGGRFAKAYQVHEYGPREHYTLEVGTLDELMARANEIVEELRDKILSSKTAGWRNDPMSEKQWEAIKRLGFDPVQIRTKGKASDIQSFKYAQFYLRDKNVLDISAN